MTQWWPLGKPIPDGWRLIQGQYICHHHTYGVLLEKIDAGE